MPLPALKFDDKKLPPLNFDKPALPELSVDEPVEKKPKSLPELSFDKPSITKKISRLPLSPLQAVADTVAPRQPQQPSPMRDVLVNALKQSHPIFRAAQQRKDIQPAMKLFATHPKGALGIEPISPEQLEKTDQSWYELLKADRPKDYMKFKESPTAQQWYGKFGDELALNLGDELLGYATDPEKVLVTHLAFTKAFPYLGNKALQYISTKNPQLYKFLTQQRNIIPPKLKARVQGEMEGIKFRVKRAMGMKQPTELIPSEQVGLGQKIRRAGRAGKPEVFEKEVIERGLGVVKEPVVKPKVNYQDIVEKGGGKYISTWSDKGKDLINFEAEGVPSKMALKGVDLTPENVKQKIADTVKKFERPVEPKLVEEPTPEVPEAVKPPVKEVTPEVSLIEEAKKYKSVEDFINFMRGSATQYRDYNPQLRAKYQIFEDSARISELGIDPEKEIVIYRGVPNAKTQKINDGDFVTVDKLSAESYAGKENVVSKKVKAKDLITDSASEFDKDKPFGLGAEFIYSDSKNKISYLSDKQLTDIWNKAKAGGTIEAQAKAFEGTAEEFVESQGFLESAKKGDKGTVKIENLTLPQAEIDAAKDNIGRGYPAQTEGAVEVVYDPSVGRLEVSNGYHRIVEAMERGEDTIDYIVTDVYETKSKNISDITKNKEHTKQQLTDIWKKAQGKPETILQGKKYRQVGERSIQGEKVGKWEMEYKGQWKPVVNVEISSLLDKQKLPQQVEVPPPKPSVKPKPTEPVKEEPKKIRATVEGVEGIRKKYGLGDVDVDTAKKWTGVFEKAKDKVKDAPFIAKSIISKPRVLENEEFAALLTRRAELEEIIDATESDAAKAVDSGSEVEQQRQAGIMTGAMEELDNITEALRWSNREAGRALNIVKLTIEKEATQYKLSKLLTKAKIAKGKKLTEKEVEEFTDLSNKIKGYEVKEKDLQKQIEKLEEQLAKKDADRSFGATTKGLKRKRTRESLVKERTDLFSQLSKIGYRLNDITGVTYESSKIISKLALNYFEEGTTKIEDIAEQITSQLPDLTKKDVYDSVGGRIKATKGKVVSETKLKLNELKRQARLLGQVEDAYNGVFDQVKKNPKVSPRVGELRKKLKELKDVATKSIRDEARLNRILQKIEKLDDVLITGEGITKKVRKIDADAIKEAKQDLSELRRLITANEKIKDLENQLKTGDFKIPVKINRVVKRADLMEAQIKLSQLRREAREKIHNLRKRTKREIFVDIASLPRELMATADFSAAGRQAAILSALDPIATLKILKESLPAFFLEDKATEIDLKIKQHENHPIRVKAGLQIKSTENVSFSKREEYFMSTIGEKIPLYGHVVRGSNRHMVSHLNLIRAMSFDRFLKLYPDATDAELKNWANYVNIASGIGDLGAFNKVASELSVAFFSPRFSMSRIQMPYEVLKYKDTPRVKKEIAKNYMKFISLVGLTLWLAHLGGADIELDPESPDWLKIKIGDTRIDPWGGLQQPARLSALAMLKTLQAGGVYKLKRNINLSDAISRFIRYKISPWLSILSELVEGKSVVGELKTPAESVVGHFTPLVAEEIVETYKSNKVLGTILAPLILLGVGVQTYKRKTIEEKQIDILKKVDKSPGYFKRLSEGQKKYYYRWKLAKERPNATRAEVGAYYKKYGLDKDGQLSKTQYDSFKNKTYQLKTGQRKRDVTLAKKVKDAPTKQQKQLIIDKAIEDSDIRKSEIALIINKLRSAGIINKKFADELKRKHK